MKIVDAVKRVTDIMLVAAAQVSKSRGIVQVSRRSEMDRLRNKTRRWSKKGVRGGGFAKNRPPSDASR